MIFTMRNMRVRLLRDMSDLMAEALKLVSCHIELYLCVL